tara:strand:- start:278 stop:835 length:558 start_codon:yes stop_codon:yes gene_type:complete
MNKRPIYWIIPNVISKKEILSINRIFKKSGIIEPEENAATMRGMKLKYTASKIIKYMHIKKYLSNIIESCYVINREQYGFDVNPINIHDYALTNSYGVEGRYDWHTDVANNLRFEDFKLTILLNISVKPYEGGDLEIFHHEIIKVENFKPGTLVMFPSLYNHRVTPIINGERRSLTLFMKGPSLR